MSVICENTTNAIRIWDFTSFFTPDWTINFNSEDIEKLRFKIVSWCAINCKNFVFQLEECPTSKRLHFQGRINLKNRVRNLNNYKEDLKRIGCSFKFSPTSKNCQSWHYVMKEASRVLGPWSDVVSEVAINLPEDIKFLEDENKYFGWQKSILEICKTYNQRKVDFIYDPIGNKGKSTFTKYLNTKKIARMVPPVLTNAKDIMQFIASDINQNGAFKCYIIDIPRGGKYINDPALWTGIEQLKNGYVFDTRYKSSTITFTCPRVIIFSNSIADKVQLSADRWNFYKINDNNELSEIESSELLSLQVPEVKDITKDNNEFSKLSTKVDKLENKISKMFMNDNNIINFTNNLENKYFILENENKLLKDEISSLKSKIDILFSYIEDINNKIYNDIESATSSTFDNNSDIED